MTVCGIKHADGVCVMGECPHFKTCCPVVWDKSGEPMTKEIKIRCDDCKFVEDCVDYGWQDCKKFTPKPSKPMTNEEWFCGLSTEEKAKWLAGILFAYGDRWTREDEIWIRSETWLKWLKEIHTKGVTDETKMATAY